MGGNPRNQWPVKIGDRRYILEPAAAAFGPIGIIRQHNNDTAEPSERSFHNPGVWRRYRDTWVQGAGQEWLDDGARQNAERFRLSIHCDVGTDRAISMVKDHEISNQQTNSNRQFLVVADGQLYWLFDNDCYRLSDPIATTWVHTDIGGTGPVTSAIYINGQIITAHGEGNPPRALLLSTQVWSQFSITVTPEFLAYGAGRLIGGEGPSLYELDVNGDKQGNADIMTHLNTSFDWMGAQFAPTGMFAWGDNETSGEIWYGTVDEADGSLNHPTPTVAMPTGEWVTAMMVYGTVVVIGTNKGSRLGVISTDGSMQFGKIIMQTDYPIWDFDTQGQYVFAPYVFNKIGPAGENAYGIMKMDLGQFIDNEEFVPARWSDLSGLVDATVSVDSVVTFGDVRWFAAHVGSDVVVVREDPDMYERETAFLLTGKITFGTPVHKRFMRLKMSWDSLPLGASIRAFVRKDDDDPWRIVMEANDEGSRGGIAAIDPTIIGPHVELKFEMDRSASFTEAPVIRSYALEAIPLPFKTREFVLPLQISETVSESYGTGKAYLDPIDELEYLLNLEDTRELVPFEFGSLCYTGIVDEVRLDQTREITATHRWSEDKEVLTGATYVRITTVDVDEGIDVGLD